jgi:hypothetical protein
VSITLGKNFFLNTGYSSPNKIEIENKHIQTEVLDDSNLRLYFDKLIELVHKDTIKIKADANLRNLQMWTIIYFGIGLLLILVYKELFSFFGMGSPEN